MAYDNNLTGVLFRNDKKEKDTQPDYKGSCEIDGTEYWIAGWKKAGKDGPLLSLKFSAKEAATTKAKPATKPADDLDNDIPF